MDLVAFCARPDTTHAATYTPKNTAEFPALVASRQSVAAFAGAATADIIFRQHGFIIRLAVEERRRAGRGGRRIFADFHAHSVCKQDDFVTPSFFLSSPCLPACPPAMHNSPLGRRGREGRIAGRATQSEEKKGRANQIFSSQRKKDQRKEEGRSKQARSNPKGEEEEGRHQEVWLA